MCGIAGIISRDGERRIGVEMTRMLQSMKHRGPDSTGYALYGPPSDDWIMRVKLADAKTPRDFDFNARMRANRNEIERRLRQLGATVQALRAARDYALEARFAYDGDLKVLAHRVEDVPGAEVLWLGHSLQIGKDLSRTFPVAARSRL